MKRQLKKYLLLGVVACALPALSFGIGGKKTCVYADRNGVIKQVDSITSIPREYQSSAQCFDANQNSFMADPKEVSLKGNVREEYISSSVGRISLRWPRTAETLFGRTPVRAMADAASTVSRVLKGAGFTPELQRLSLEWNVVFMDENVPVTQIPAYLVSNCHPAWMTPPANLYIVAQRVVAGCSGSRGGHTNSVNDAQLSQVLIHEMGHAVEYALLKGKGGGDRMRAEGFASWFEQYGSDFSSVNTKGAARQYYSDLAKQAFAQSPDRFTFQGSAHDYARASMFFHAIVNKRGVRGLMDVYDGIINDNLDFFSAIDSKMGWNAATLNAESMRALK